MARSVHRFAAIVALQQSSFGQSFFLDSLAAYEVWRKYLILGLWSIAKHCENLMTADMDRFIQLHRTFHSKRESDDSALSLWFRSRRDGEFRWQDLWSKYRVVLLSEAGSGKTTELRNAARHLRREGKHAFFMRIENISDSFENAFEEGSFESFEAWLRSDEEAWLFLDSVDEARLRGYGDFEKAVNNLSRQLQQTLQRVHIVIASRPSAWRPSTDAQMFRAKFPYHPVKNSCDDTEPQGDGQAEEDAPKTTDFMIVALDDLRRDQIDAFLRTKGIENPADLCQAIEREKAWLFTARPQDLAELIELWKERAKIGSWRELMESSIKRRLMERDQNRAEAQSISDDDLRHGVRLLAAASTLVKEAGIRVPDGAEQGEGIPVREVLSTWSTEKCSILLGRPIFDAGVYGTVRFHHRSVREYLSAEWLYELLKKSCRRQVEGLLFGSIYGTDVILPTMRPVLPWLVLLDSRIRERVCDRAPEIFFEGGDPGDLPQEIRSKVLHSACQKWEQYPHRHQYLADTAAIQRFAKSDLVDDIKSLLNQYRENDEITAFLLRMIWLGEIKEAASEAKSFALDSRAKRPRIEAFRALKVIGSESDKAEVWRDFLAKEGDVDPDWLLELLPCLPHNEEAVEYFLTAQERVPDSERNSVLRAWSHVTFGWPLPLLSRLLSRLHELLEQSPRIARGACKVSERYAWLLPAATRPILRLIEERDSGALGPAVLSTLYKLANAEKGLEFPSMRKKLREGIVGWPELNHALFWSSVVEKRAVLDADGGKPQPQRPGPFLFLLSPQLFSLNDIGFDRACEDIETRQLLDHRLVALHVAFRIYRSHDCPEAWRERLNRLVDNDPELGSELDQLLLPPPPDDQEEWQRADERYAREQDQYSKRQQDEETEKLNQWRMHLEAHPETLRKPQCAGAITDEQRYLLNILREPGSTNWSELDWRVLNPVCGESVARAFRDGAVGFWRTWVPPLFSDGAQTDAIWHAVWFGLIGLSIEAQDDPNWPENLSPHLSPQEAEVAMRYALHELNGFPSWLERLCKSYPETVTNVLIPEIDAELADQNSESLSHHVLDRVSCCAQWMWDQVAPQLLERLRQPCPSVGNLRYMLNIVQGSSLDDLVVAELAKEEAHKAEVLTAAPMWFAMWVGADPANAVQALQTHLATIEGRESQTEFAMRFMAALIGRQHEVCCSRLAYRKPEHVQPLKQLYLLMCKYVRPEDDIVRKGVYSPGRRDDAQDARNALFSFIRETSGKEAFTALMDISCEAPSEKIRLWSAFCAQERAAQEADSLLWTSQCIRDFHHNCEGIPGNHRELWELAVNRL